MSSVHLEPFRLLTHLSSRFLSNESSFNSRSSGITANASRAKVKSIGIPRISVTMMGTKASGTA